MNKTTLIISTLLFLVQSTISIAQSPHTIHGEDYKIHFQTFGTGEPLLIINGGPGMSSQGFISLAQELSGNHQTIIYDQRGTGHSTLSKVDSSTVTMDLMAEDIEMIRKYLEIREWVIMGHSFGGMLAYYYSGKYPSRVKGMIQSSSGGMDLTLLENLNISDALTETEQDSLSFYTEKINNGDRSYETLLKRGEFLAPAYLYNKEYVDIIAERLTQGNSQINSLVWQNLQRNNFNTKDHLKDFDKPVLILHGLQDVVGTDIAETAYTILPNARLILLDRCRHYGWLDRPDQFFSEIRRFLSVDTTFVNEKKIL